jgi:hypothetical protein
MGMAVEMSSGILNGSGGEPGVTVLAKSSQSANGIWSAGTMSSVVAGSGELTESVGIPPIGYISLSRPLRYRLTPQLPRWKGIDVLLGTPLEQETRGRLAFQVCLENGNTIREGEVPFAVEDAKGGWVKLRFAEFQHSVGQTFLLTLCLEKPHAAKVGVFEAQRTRAPLTEMMARKLGVLGVRANPFLRLVYAQ